MITIKQLLESVDLDFEPRWVTKDESGEICIWDCNKPELDGEIWNSPNDEHYECLGKIKLSEFDDKDWTECIYEVPRKTTGKIENFTIFDFEKINKVVDKLNLLVDAVNKHADIIQQIGDWGASKGECLWCEKITKVNLEK